MLRLMRSRFPLLLFVTLLSLAGCRGAGGGEAPGRDRILLWHTWSGQDVQFLNGLLADYSALHPDVDIISVAVPAAELPARFAARSQAGLSPDLVLVDADAVYSLAQEGLLRDLANLNLDLSMFLSPAMRMVGDDTRLFGLPFATHTQVLFYNKNMTDAPPEDIPALLERIEAGEVLAQNPGFEHSFWGVGAYNGALLDDQGRLLIDRGGFTNWLGFLAAARSLPGFLHDDDAAALRQAFVDGEATYFVADSGELPALYAAMGADAVGVALLPKGPNGGAPRPLLALDAFAFSKASSAEEFNQALDLVKFLSDSQTQLTLISADLGRAPVNSQVRLTPSLPLNTLTVARQIRTAQPIAFVNRPIWHELRSGALGFLESYRQVSRGVVTPDDMVEQAVAGFAAEYDLTPRPQAPAELCPEQPGAATVWHALRGDEAQVFTALADEFAATCPGVTLELSFVPYAEVVDRFTQEALAGGGPDLLYENSRWLAPLAERGLLLDLSERVTPSFLQQFIPGAVQTMRYNQRLYGIPESVTVLALFYNTTQIADPPIDLQQLVQGVDASTRLALPVSFYRGYWGMDPFGGFEFDSYTGTLLDVTGLTAWLDALQRVDDEPGTDLYFDYAAAEDAFAFEEAAYLVAGSSALPRLREELGEDRFRVVPLPSGPYKPGSPMLQVRGAMVNANADALSAAIALAFGQFINLPQSQHRFLETGSHVTASVTVNLNAYPNLDSFREQAKVAALVVENSNFVTMEEYGNALYEAVLREGADPAAAVAQFVEDVHAATGATDTTGDAAAAGP
ncbi:MAG: extracellular solute-binding protein [Caldilineaceae bacterium]